MPPVSDNMRAMEEWPLSNSRAIVCKDSHFAIAPTCGIFVLHCSKFAFYISYSTLLHFN